MNKDRVVEQLGDRYLVEASKKIKYEEIYVVTKRERL